jgi:hypothetical protein
MDCTIAALSTITVAVPLPRPRETYMGGDLTVAFLSSVSFFSFSVSGRFCLTSQPIIPLLQLQSLAVEGTLPTMIPRRSSIVLLAAGFTLSSLAIATCYMPNGTAETDPLFVPCNRVGSTDSMCCRTSDICLPNGLCLNYNQNSPFYWRESCTDPTWQSPYCLNLCLSPNEINPGEAGNAFVLMIQCPDDSWCCGGINDNVPLCCQQKRGVMLAATIGVTSTAAPASSATTTYSSTTASTFIPTSTSTSQADTGLTSSAKIGLGVGLSLGGVLVAAAITWLVVKRRQRRQAQHTPADPYSTPKAPTREPQPYDARRDGNQLSGPMGNYELVEGGLARGRWELPSS